MSQALLQTKKRIKSVEATQKITRAMKLVSTVKLQATSKAMFNNRVFSNKLSEIASLILSSNKMFYDKKDENEEIRRLFIIISSSLGLCGSYNHNLFDFVNTLDIKPNDEVVVLGSKGCGYFSAYFPKAIYFPEYNGTKSNGIVDMISNKIVDDFKSSNFEEISVIYTSYKNTITFKPSIFKLFPIEVTKKEKYIYEPLFEPSKEELCKTVVPLYLKGKFYSLLLESEVSEQASRRNAMDNATNNANDLKKKLDLEFNKARQGAITQEIIEVSNGQ